MATAGALAQNAQLISSLLGGAKTLFGSKSNTSQVSSGGTQTQQTMLSQQAVNALLQDLFEREDLGLARVASGARIPGMYNTTTQQLLINDLLARSAAQVEKARAPTVTTKTPETTTKQTVEPGMLSGNIGKLALLGAGAYGAKKLFDSGSAIADAAKLASVIPDATTMADISTSLSSLTSIGGDMGISGAADLSGFMTNFPAASGADIFGSVADTAAFAGDQLSVFDAAGQFPVISTISNVLEGDVGGLAGTGVGWMVGGPIGAVIGNIVGGEGGIGGFVESVGGIVDTAADFVGDVLGGIGEAVGCFITTAVCHHEGKSDDCYELTRLREYRDTWLKENHPEDIEQYYNEAPVIVSRISSREDAATIYKQFDRDYIQPAVAAIEESAYETAYAIYKNLFNVAKEIAGGTNG